MVSYARVMVIGVGSDFKWKKIEQSVIPNIFSMLIIYDSNALSFVTRHLIG